MPPAQVRRGRGLPEVIVVLVLVLLATLILITALPRQRENGRLATCQFNLMQIGRALVLYQQATDRLPGVPRLDSGSPAERPGPLRALLGELDLPDFLEIGRTRQLKHAGGTVSERPVPGFVCPSDPLALASGFAAPVSYRATTGDQVNGGNGGFAPGRLMRIEEIENADGASHTAAFAERLVGDGQNHLDPRNYMLTPAPVPAAGCGSSGSAWRGDAGSSWTTADWTSTLYNHTLAPDSLTSCIADDGRTSHMGASSGHSQRVHVLLFDGSVRGYTPRVDLKIWRGLANTDDAGSLPPHRPQAGRTTGAAGP